MTLKAVLFDFGGVLTKACWDTHEIAKLVAQALIDAGITPPEELIDTMRNTLDQRLLKVIKTQIEERMEDIIVEVLRKLDVPFNNTVISRALDYIMDAPFCQFREETDEVIKTLKKWGLKLGIVSNSPIAFHRRILKKRGLLAYFDAIIISCEVMYRKPHPEIFRIALNRLKVKPQEAIFIGDDLEIDIKGAKRVGIRGILIRNGDPYWLSRKKYLKISSDENIDPDYIINSLREMLDIIKREIF